MDEDTIGRRIRRIRRAQDVTQVELAERSGLTFNSINRIENDHMKPRFETMSRIAYALGVPPGELFPQEEFVVAGKADAPTEVAGRQTVARGPGGDEGEEEPTPPLSHDVEGAFRRLVRDLRDAGVKDEAIPEMAQSELVRVLERGA